MFWLTALLLQSRRYDKQRLLNNPEVSGHPLCKQGRVKAQGCHRLFNVDLKDKTAIDVGSSTGGFTDCMLQMGAKKIYCIDVGYGQIAWSLRNDPRVILLERTNIRHLERERIPDIIDIATIDVSFISLTKVIPKVLEFLKENGENTRACKTSV